MAKWQEAPIVQQPGGGWREAPPIKQPEPQPAGPGLLPTAAAGAARGVLSTLDILPRGLMGAYNVLAGQPTPGAPQQWGGSPFQAMGAALGLGQTQPQTPSEERAAFAGEMLGASMLPAGIAGRVAGLPAAAGEMLAGAGAAGGGLISEQAGAGRMPGILAGGLAPGTASAAARRAMMPQQMERAAPRIAAAERQGIPLTAGQATGGNVLERMTETLPFGASTKERFLENQAERMGARLEQMTSGATEPGTMTAGGAITQGIDDWATRFRATARENYDAIEQIVPMGTVAEPESLRGAVEALRGRGAFAGMTDNPLTERIGRRLDELPEGAVNYQDLKELRTMIGAQLSTPSIVADAPRAQLKQLYGAISDDMRRTLQDVGGDEAIDAWKIADSQWKAGMERIDKILEPIQRRKTPEEVYKAAMAGTREGATKIRALKETLDPEQWDIVRRTVARQLGETTPGAQTLEQATARSETFNPERFLTNVARIRPEARQVLFEGARDLNDLVQMASGIQTAANYMRNPSGTARMMYQAALPAAGVGMYLEPSLIGPMAGLAAGTAGVQKFLQSPAGVRWATQGISPLGAGGLGMAPRMATGQQ